MTTSIKTVESTDTVATSTTVGPSSNLFKLTMDEQRTFNEIVADLCPNAPTEEGAGKIRTAINGLCPNAAEMQQYAIEASKLLTATGKRLDEYKKAGFFKRLWWRITGKTGAMERANDQDIIAMQKLAWFYLMELQNQNLLQARAIVVIRNNLKDVLKEHAETNEMIRLLTERLDARLKNLEYSLEEVKWVAYLDGRKTEFLDPEEYPVLCALEIVFDYLKTFRDFARKRCDENVWSMPLDIVAPIRAALAKFGIIDKFGLGRDYTVQKFINALLLEEQGFDGGFEEGRAKVKAITELWGCLEGRRAIEYKYALKTVKGIGFNALYSYNEQMDNAKDVLKLLENDKPEKIARKVVTRMMVNAPDTKYSIVDLASEIIGGCQIVMEMDFNANRPKLEVIAEPAHELPPPKQDEKCEDGTAADGSKKEEMAVRFQDVCGRPGRLKAGATFHINKDKVKKVLGNSYLTDYLPDGVSVDVNEDGDWELPEEGEVKFKKGSRNVDESLLGDNPAALELDYDEDDGTFGGSFKVYQVTGKPTEFTVNGVLIDDVGYGMAYGEKGIGAFAVVIG